MLKIVKGTMEFLTANAEATPQMSRVPELPKVTESPPMLTVATPEMTAQCMRYSEPLVAVPDGGGGWRYCDQRNKFLPNKRMRQLEGERFVEDDGAVFDKQKNGAQGMKLTNATIRLTRIREDYYSESYCRETWILAILCPEMFGDEEQEISIPREDSTRAVKIIREKYPGVFVASANPDALNEYLAKVFQRDAASAPREVHVMCSGWHVFEGKTRFYVGEDPPEAKDDKNLEFYASCFRPVIQTFELPTVFSEGVSYLEIGHSNAVIVVLLLTALEGYDAFWLKQVGIVVRSMPFLLGFTGYLKTSAAAVLAAVHHGNRDFATIRVTASKASLRDRLVKMRDQVIVVDDYSNSETTTRNKALENMEDVIRAKGDGVIPAKMAGKNFTQSVQRSVRCTVILTGEEAPPLGQSSWNRLVTLRVDADTFDGAVLQRFQDNPMIMNRFFTAFEDFWTEHGTSILTSCRKQYDQYREEYRAILPTRRFADAAAGLRVQADILCQFALFCRMPLEWGQAFSRLAEQCISDVFQVNQHLSGQQDPVRRFLDALIQSLGTTRYNGLADDEETYVKNISAFVGFREKKNGLLWFRVADAMQMVRDYYHKLGQTWLPEETTMKKMLWEKGVSEGEKGSKYLRRAKKGPRLRMLVLRVDAVGKILNMEGLLS